MTKEQIAAFSSLPRSPDNFRMTDPHGRFAMAAKHPEIVVKLDGAGDDFRIIGQVSKAMRRGGIAEDEIENFCDEAISGHDRDLLRICGRWVTLVPE